jgi:hypothetical protein
MENNWMTSRAKFAVFAVAVVVATITGTKSQSVNTPPKPRPKISTTRLAPNPNSIASKLYAVIDGKERQIANEAFEAWIIRGGKQLVYSGRDGSGGFENEGQSLRLFDPATNQRRKILSEYFEVNKVSEVTTRGKKTALLVEMGDGGLGASYVAVIDPDRGEVFFRRWAKIISRSGDTITIGHFKEDDWDKIDSDPNAKVSPYKIEKQNLGLLLKRRVIINQRIG